MVRSPCRPSDVPVDLRLELLERDTLARLKLAFSLAYLLDELRVAKDLDCGKYFRWKVHAASAAPVMTARR